MKNKELIGIFKGNKKGFGFVELDVDMQEENLKEIFISRKYINNAVDGDKVKIKLINQEKNNKTNKKMDNSANSHHIEGKIIKILEHTRENVVGLFQKSKDFGFVVPDDKKINTDIYIPKKYCKNIKNNQKVVVQILKYPEKNKNAEGKIIEILGNINEAGVDMLSLVKEYDLPYEFPKNVIEEAKKIPQEINKDDIKNRIDLRNKIFFTIDGEDAKDLDDAICIEKLANGNFKLIVSIADVSYYVKEGSQIDKEAILRGTSIYMLDRVIPMLPKELSNGICSLNQNVDRFALSVFMEINCNGKVISSDIKKSIINVKRRMSYKEVQAILDYISKPKNNSNTNLKEEELRKLIKECNSYINLFKDMEELTLILKEMRRKNGSLELDIPESKIILDKNGHAIDIKKYENYFSNEIIEQFMLITNETVAEKFYWLEAPFIYRVHDVPDIEKIEELNKFLWNLGYKIKASKDNIHSKAFADVLDKIKGKKEERIVSNLILRTLKLAKYEDKNKGHFGIASKYYCHFTSPIRRYPDLFIHRVISKYLEAEYNIKDNILEKYEDQSKRYADSSSEREKIAQKVERDAEKIKMAEYMQDRINEEYKGIISSITSFGIFVELENTVEGLIRFDDLGEEYFIYDEQHKTLLGENSKKLYKIGDKINIKVIAANKVTRQIDFKRIDNDIK